MKMTKLFYGISFFLVFILITGCRNKTSTPNPALASIDLRRGELLLCSTENFGEVAFSLSCNYETRETFNLALALLHSFEYAEAEKAFVKVIDKDPDCAMAYWGVSMSIFHSLWMQTDLSYLKKGQQLLEIAQQLEITEREKDYLDAISIFYENWETLDKNTRQVLYEEKMEKLYKKHKDDAEAAIFYALAVRAASDPNDKTYRRQRKSGEILEGLFKDQPEHPGIAHYIIHNYDYPELAEKALTTARRYAEIAPASAHAQHMPSHIFTRLGLWEESISTNINSAASAVCYAEIIKPGANWTQELHAVDYLVYAYLQIGDNQNALEQLNYVKAVEKVFPENHFASTYALVAIPVRMVLENKQWNKAAELVLPTIDFPWEELHWETAMHHFGRALGLAHIGELASAEKELQVLHSLHKKLADKKDQYKAGQVMIQIKAADAWIQLARGNKDEALQLMRIAAKLESQTSKHAVTPGEVLPADELLGDMLIALEMPEEALKAYQINLQGHPNRFNGLYGAAKASQHSGDTEGAIQYYQTLIQLSEHAKSDRPELQEAKLFLEKNS